MNDDPNDLMSFVFMDARGRNPVVVRKVHPQFDPERVAFRMVIPSNAAPDDVAGRIVVAWNPEFQTPSIDGLSYHYLIRGTKPLAGAMPANHEYFSWHLSETARANPRQAIRLPIAATFLADALVGINKPLRVDLIRQIRAAGLLDRCLVSLYNTTGLHSGEEVYASPSLAQYDDPRITQTKRAFTDWHSMSQVTSDTRVVVPASQIIPRQIYAASWISVIAETHPEMDQFFVTEKTGKAFAAGRIFLLQGGQGYLRHLRELGFQTFAPLIDESYDDLEDCSARTAAIVAELKRLSTLDLRAIYHALTPVLEHNQQLIYSGELNKPAQRFLRDIQARHG